MGLFDEMLGGDDERRRDYDDFAQRYDGGHPAEGYDDDEVGRRYGEVASEIDPDTYHESARGAFERMDPDDRRHFGQMLHEQAGARGYDTGYDGYSDDPQSLAAMTSRVHQQDPGLLGSLLGGGMGGMGGLGGGMGGLGGGMGGMGGLGGMLGGMGGGNPLARAALAGITTMAMRSMTGRR